MIATISEGKTTLASWRSPGNSPLKDTFTHILEQEVARATPTEPPPPPTYTVQRGDSLWSIAKKFGLADTRQLARLNALENPDLLQVGQVLALPRETPDRGAFSFPQAAAHKQRLGGQGPTPRILSPLKTPAGAEEGQLVTASWYGPRHHGKLMANGQPFNMHADTAAHPTLPFGTGLRLTNPANGRSVEVQVTDRGPFIPGRSLDLSYGAAHKLGMIKAGVIRLYMERS
jgi:rare lipoprotein A